jgi:ubiquinone/menaquinone biosynthesis C-methylase UbiE
MRVDPLAGHRIWSRTYDDVPNPLLALEQRTLAHLLGPLDRLRIVDVACGTGRWMSRAHAQGAVVAGIDFCPEMLAHAARKKGVRGCIAQAHAARLPIRDSIADLALCSFALSYFPAPGEAIAELVRIVRPGGRVALADLHPHALQAGWKRSFRSGSDVYEIDCSAHPSSHIDETAQQCGLRLVRELDACFGPAEREIFRRAGKEDVFPEACRIPAVHISVWTKQ